MFKRNKKVYVVTGFCWEKENNLAYPLRLDRVFSTYNKALMYIEEIAEDALNEAEEMEWVIDKLFFNEDYKTLEIAYENGIEENFIITESEVQ